METNDIGKPLQEWMPMQRPGDIARVGKALEELGECVSALARALIQGMEGTEPATGKPNSQWVAEEIADVNAMLAHVKQRFALDEDAILERGQRKFAWKAAWLRFLDAVKPAE